MITRRRRSKTNHVSFGDIEPNPNGKNWKRVSVHVCIGCMKKRAELDGVICQWCKTRETKAEIIVKGINDKEKEIEI